MCFFTPKWYWKTIFWRWPQQIKEINILYALALSTTSVTLFLQLKLNTAFFFLITYSRFLDNEDCQTESYWVKLWPYSRVKWIPCQNKRTLFKLTVYFITWNWGWVTFLATNNVTCHGQSLNPGPPDWQPDIVPRQAIQKQKHPQ